MVDNVFVKNVLVKMIKKETKEFIFLMDQQKYVLLVEKKNL